jgi:serine/threonine-protein kinase HipA
MQRLFVYADFDFLKEIEPIGVLGYERLRGNDCYSFEFNTEWLQKHPSIKLSADLENFPGIQYTKPGKEIFSCFSDALPDRWGRTLLNKREFIQAQEEKRPIKRLTSFDYLMGIDDFSRMGGFRFKLNPDEDFINNSTVLKIPPLTKIFELFDASKQIELSEIEHTIPEMKWLNQLLHPGTSLGGARPKASVVDSNQNLNIAKFPSINDEYDVGLWEFLSNQMAKIAGINIPESKVIKNDNRFHSFISKRFDRLSPNTRVQFASALSLLGLEDGDNASSGKGYIDIVDFILQSCTDSKSNIEELYRRVAFNICIGNSDDHFRNHGFLLTPKGWTLSPVYDLNPTLNDFQTLLINSKTNEADLGILLDSYQEYMINRSTAENIIKKVVDSVSQWEVLARNIHVPKYEIDRFREKFSKNKNFRF